MVLVHTGVHPFKLQLNELAFWLAKEMDSITHDVLYKGPLAEVYEGLRGKFGTKDHPFVFQVQYPVPICYQLGIILTCQYAIAVKAAGEFVEKNDDSPLH